LHIASLNMNSGDYESAEIYYAQFVAEYPRNPLRIIARIRQFEARICGFAASHVVFVAILLLLLFVLVIVFARVCLERIGAARSRPEPFGLT
jgi:hypothetical protein